jgi:ABC-2 type transport system ATP-binding protein
MSAASLVSLDAVTVRYGELVALDDVTLELTEPRVGLLGPNGAGKSTLLKAILGLVHPTAGEVRVLGRRVADDPLGVRALIGYMPEGDTVLPELTALAYVTLAAELSGLPGDEARGRAHQVLHHVGLGEARYRRLGTFSTGMKQRARLAQALVGDPKLLLLDEPTSGLDPRGRDEMLALVREIPERTGARVLLSTHILPDVEKTCDGVMLLDGGRIRQQGPLASFLATEGDVFELRVREGTEVEDPGGPAPDGIRGPLEAAGCRVARAGSAFHVAAPPGLGATGLLRLVTEAGAQVRHLAPVRRTLEDAFLNAMDG